jgi:hypothetical protein
MRCGGAQCKRHAIRVIFASSAAGANSAAVNDFVSLSFETGVVQEFKGALGCMCYDREDAD